MWNTKVIKETCSDFKFNDIVALDRKEGFKRIHHSDSPIKSSNLLIYIASHFKLQKKSLTGSI